MNDQEIAQALGVLLKAEIEAGNFGRGDLLNHVIRKGTVSPEFIERLRSSIDSLRAEIE